MSAIRLGRDVTSYRQFLAIKGLPTYRFQGRQASFPDEYSDRVNGVTATIAAYAEYSPSSFLFDYQAAIAEMAIRKKRFSVFADCGLGKTLIIAEWARHVAVQTMGKVLIVSPIMVIDQTIDEFRRFYGSHTIHRVSAADLPCWLADDSCGVAITNYEAMRPGLPMGTLSGIVLDESSILKSHYGKWGQVCLDLGAGVEYKLACTGTPAPNDRIEYANHAVFCDQYTSVNAFLALYFVNRGQTQNRWELKPHALKPFYRSLSHWCIFLTNPSTYGWKDNCETLPPIHTHIHDVELTPKQVKLAYSITGQLFANDIGGITNRTALSAIAKGSHKGKSVPTNKPEFIKSLVHSFRDESTIIWCQYNREQESIESVFPDAASISGDTPVATRRKLIDEFKSGDRKVLISKPKILGFGLNLQIATRQVFSGLMDSYELYYQAVKRSNRYGSTKPLNVHIPVTDIERPMIDTVMRKASRVDEDTRTQERIFRECSI